MAAPVADKIILPVDTGNTGKKTRTQTRVVGSDTVHEHFFIPTSQRSKLGSYKASIGAFTVPTAAQNGTTTGVGWLYNPVGNAPKMAIRRSDVVSQFVALAVDLLAGDLRLSLFTFTGTGSGTQITPAKRASADATPTGQLRTASTGLTVTLGATLWSSFLQTMDLATGGAGHWNPYQDGWEMNEEDEQVILAAGEGVVLWNASAVTTTNRRLSWNLAWEEYE